MPLCKGLFSLLSYPQREKLAYEQQMLYNYLTKHKVFNRLQLA